MEDGWIIELVLAQCCVGNFRIYLRLVGLLCPEDLEGLVTQCIPAEAHVEIWSLFLRMRKFEELYLRWTRIRLQVQMGCGEYSLEAIGKQFKKM